MDSVNVKVKRCGILMLFLAFVLAQENVTAQVAVYVKKNGELTLEKDSADFKRVIYELDSNANAFPITDVYLNGNVKSRGFVTRVDPPLYQGQKIDYYPNGKMRLNVHYEKGKAVGDAFSYNPNGKLYAVMECSDTTYNALNSGFKRLYLIKSAKDSLGNDIVVDGKGHYIQYDEEMPEQVIAEGEVLNGRWNGQITGRELTEGLTYVDNYVGGKLVSGVAKDSLGEEYPYNKEIIPAAFKGGMPAFYEYLRHEVRYPNAAQNKKIQGRVFLKFMVEADGLITNVEITNKIDPLLGNEAIRVIKKSGTWEPAIFRGKPIKSVYRIPIGFTLSY